MKKVPLYCQKMGVPQKSAVHFSLFLFVCLFLFISYVGVTCRLPRMSATPQIHFIPIRATFPGSLIEIIAFSQAYITRCEREALEVE